jgi:alkylhydroperoxidase/carboxymuconolactone decarboxylase family protein YurZ
VSDTAVPTVVPSAGRAREHDRVVRAALERGTPLPARFGQVVAGERELIDAVSERRSVLVAALTRVQGAVEMTVRMLVPPPTTEHVEEPAVGAESTARGRRYLERVAALQREERNVLARAALIRDRVNSAVGDLVRDQSFTGAAAGSSLATLSHLVPREGIEAYRSALQSLREEDPALTIMVSGPWAPYSFTEGIGT